MNRRTMIVMASIAAGSMLLFGLISGSVMLVLSVPFTLMSDGLRALSLSGSLGNIAAIVLYALICLSPLLLGLRRKWKGEDWLLVLASGMMFYVMYQMINPGLMPAAMANSVGKVIYSGAVISTLISWGVLKLLRGSDSLRQKNSYQVLAIFLKICAAVCVMAGFGAGFGNFRDSIAQIQASNTMPGLNLTPTYLFAFAAFASGALEYSLDAVVMLWGVRLLEELEKDAYSEECYTVAEKIGDLCRKFLGIITLTNLALNLGQVIFASSLYNVDLAIHIPVFSMALVFGTLALMRLLRQGRVLKEDNDLFI